MLETVWKNRWLPDLIKNSKWGYSSVGRAPALQAGGQEFESLHLHLASLYVALRKTSFFSVACRHAMKSKLHKCLWKQASSTFLKFRFRNVPWKSHIEIIDLKYLRYKTSEAYRKIRNRKNQVNTKTRGATLCTFVLKPFPRWRYYWLS